MNFGIITIAHGRQTILRLFCASIRRLRKETGIDFPVVVTSGAEDAPLCSEYNIGHITYPNIPVSNKWNIACEYMKELGVDYICILGSDDIMATDCLRNIMFEMHNDIDLIGFKTLYVYDTDGDSRGQLMRTTKKSFLGVGKTIHRRVLDAVGWEPWAYDRPRNAGMDAIIHRNISSHIKTSAEVEGIIVDCKSRESLNRFSMFKNNHHGILTHKSVFLNILSKEEKDILNSIPHLGLPVKFPNMVKRGRTLI